MGRGAGADGTGALRRGSSQSTCSPPIGREGRRAFTEGCAAAPEVLRAAPREPWVLPLLPRSSAPAPRANAVCAPLSAARRTSREVVVPRCRRRGGRRVRAAVPRCRRRGRCRVRAAAPRCRRRGGRRVHADLRGGTSDAGRSGGRAWSGAPRMPARGQGPVDTGSSGRGPGLARSRPKRLRDRGLGSVKGSRGSGEMGGEHVSWEGPASQGPAVRRPPLPGPGRLAPRCPLAPGRAARVLRCPSEPASAARATRAASSTRPPGRTSAIRDQW